MVEWPRFMWNMIRTSDMLLLTLSWILHQSNRGGFIFRASGNQILKTDSAPWNWFGEVWNNSVNSPPHCILGGICKVSFVYPVLYQNELCFYFAKVLKV